jgi:hypothetical protein
MKERKQEITRGDKQIIAEWWGTPLGQFVKRKNQPAPINVKLCVKSDWMRFEVVTSSRVGETSPNTFVSDVDLVIEKGWNVRGRTSSAPLWSCSVKTSTLSAAAAVNPFCSAAPFVGQ